MHYKDLEMIPVTPEILLKAYRNGIFPMADNADDPFVNWVCPKQRGLLPIEHLHISRSLRKFLKKKPFRITLNTAFEQVISACAEPSSDRENTWINDDIMHAFCDLHTHGFAHSVECRDLDGVLVGGLYGLSMGAAFFGESMFSRVSNASKVALVHLTARLWSAGYMLLDAQFINHHLQQFGIYELPHADYMIQLHEALQKRTDFTCGGASQTQILKSYLEFRGFS